MKKCRRCGEYKNKNDFHKFSAAPDGLNYMCKPCFVIYRNTPEERISRGTTSKYLLGTKEYDIDSYLRNVYKITLNDYNNILIDQNYSCAICKIPQDKLQKRLSVDHNHKSGKIRGLLCPDCNHAIGKLRDDVYILQNAIDYLNKNKE